MNKILKCCALTATGALAFCATAYADTVIGKPVEGQIGFEPAVTSIARDIHWFHNDVLMPIITLIVALVLGLLIYVSVRFSEKRNQVPSKTTHHAGLEVAWTIIPVLLLVVIAIPSFRLLSEQVNMPKADVTIKVTGNQWYWSYAYPKDQGGFGFDSMIIPAAKIDASKGEVNLLSVDNMAEVPVNKIVHIQVTGADVIHSFTVPSFGIRMDAIPGRLNQTWFKADKIGIYYGQCSNICGQNHAYMPIAFKVVSEDDYKAWLVTAKKQFASIGQGPVRQAMAQLPVVGK